MYEAYFTRRLLQALHLADEASSAEERSVHLQASRHYRELLDAPEKRHSVRHAVQLKGTLHHDDCWPRQVTVSDLSVGGFRVDFPDAVKIGSPVCLQLRGLAPLPAYVVWQKDGEAGCQFAEELHPALVDAAIAVSPRVQ